MELAQLENQLFFQNSLVEDADFGITIQDGSVSKKVPFGSVLKSSAF